MVERPQHESHSEILAGLIQRFHATRSICGYVDSERSPQVGPRSLTDQHHQFAFYAKLSAPLEEISARTPAELEEIKLNELYLNLQVQEH